MPNSPKQPFDSVDDVLSDISNGKMVIVTDDESRENEGDLDGGIQGYSRGY